MNIIPNFLHKTLANHIKEYIRKDHPSPSVWLHFRAAGMNTNTQINTVINLINGPKDRNCIIQEVQDRPCKTHPHYRSPGQIRDRKEHI